MSTNRKTRKEQTERSINVENNWWVSFECPQLKGAISRSQEDEFQSVLERMTNGKVTGPKDMVTQIQVNCEADGKCL